jgi:hypothetical protein
VVFTVIADPFGNEETEQKTAEQDHDDALERVA